VPIGSIGPKEFKMGNRLSESDEVVGRQFCAHLKTVGLGETTIRNYWGDARNMLKWFRLRGFRKTMSAESFPAYIQSYRAYLGRCASTATVDRKVAAANRFFEFAGTRPADKTRTVQGRLGADEYATFCKTLGTYGTVEDRTILALLALTGLKAQQISRLRWSDLDLGAALVRVGEMSRHSVRYTALDEQSINLLRQPEFDQKRGSDDFVFNRGGHQITRRAIQMVVQRYSKWSGEKADSRFFRAIYAMRQAKEEDDVAGEPSSSIKRSIERAIKLPGPLDREVTRPKRRRTGVARGDSYRDLALPEILFATRDWLENVTDVRSGRRRNMAVRTGALARSQGQCERCGFKPPVDALLEVHHIISSGEREDRLDNCIVLCPNCHRLCHWTPIAGGLESELLRAVRLYEKHGQKLRYLARSGGSPVLRLVLSASRGEAEASQLIEHMGEIAKMSIADSRGAAPCERIDQEFQSSGDRSSGGRGSRAVKYYSACNIVDARRSIMRGEALRQARKAAGLSQLQAAEELGVSQTLLSLMEKGKRSVTFAIGLNAVKLLQASPEQLPVYERERSRDDQLAADLGALGYPGYRYLSSEPRNPAEVLCDALDRDNLDARVVEALPWLPLRYPQMNWAWLIPQAKLRNRQNRLGFVVNLSARSAAVRGQRSVAKRLYDVVAELRKARLAKNDTLCQSWWPPSQRRYAREKRSRIAAYWNLDTRLTEKDLVHSAIE
jgi:integrase/transcriptional regulator with XRE-family HTH domain